jgi:hypothetical protein
MIPRRIERDWKSEKYQLWHEAKTFSKVDDWDLCGEIGNKTHLNPPPDYDSPAWQISRDPNHFEKVVIRETAADPKRWACWPYLHKTDRDWVYLMLEAGEIHGSL